MSDIACPKCSGPMWDQKNGKFPWKPGTPIYKCRDKECAQTGGVVWPPKNGTTPTQAQSKGPVNSGPLLPNETGEEEYLQSLAGVAPGPVKPDPQALKNQDIDLLKECVGYALGIVSSAQKVVDGKLDVVFTGDNVSSLAACLFIRWTRK